MAKANSHITSKQNNGFKINQATLNNLPPQLIKTPSQVFKTNLKMIAINLNQPTNIQIQAKTRAVVV